MVMSTDNALPSRLRERLGILFLVVSASWLFAPGISHGFQPGPNLISEYESAANQFGILFRSFDLVAAALLLTGAITGSGRLIARWGRLVLPAVSFIVLLMAVDVLFPATCRVEAGICQAVPSLSAAIHNVESLLLAATVFGLSVYIVWRHKQGYWFVAAQAVAGLAILVADRNAPEWLFAFQATYQMLTAYWLYWLVFTREKLDEPQERPPAKASRIRDVIAVWVAANGVLALILSLHHMTFGRLARPLIFSVNTPWLLGHTLLVGVLLLYLARQLWQGDRRALILTSALLVSLVMHASLGRHALLFVPLFGLPLLALIYYRSIFDRSGTLLGFTSRLRFILSGVVAIVILATLATASFRAYDHRAWNRSPYDVAKVVRRVALLEVSSGADTVRRTQMFDRLLNILGGGLYLWLVVGIFAPRSSFGAGKEAADAEAMERALLTGSRSSEDYFKLWPTEGKRYLVTPGGSVVAYRQTGDTVVALADPVHPDGHDASWRGVGEFLSYCRSAGYKSLFLIIDEADISRYEKAGYTRLPVGSSARVDVAAFSDKTVRNKWWRWQMNRAKRAGYEYRVSEAPHDSTLLKSARQVSDAWLERPGHREQTFALGYYDDAYLDRCRLHCLYDGEGRLVAFANELPIFNGNHQTTVDMIRFQPAVDGAMPVLLAHTVQNLHGEGRFRYFDLGLVPLAKVETRTAKLIKQFAKDRFSSHGLAQFKNNFDPEWRPQYVAYDGDGIDLARAAVALNKAMEYEPAADPSVR